MPLIIPKSKQEKATLTINLNSALLDEIRAYYRYTGVPLNEEYDGFFEQAALYVLKKDTEFKRWKKTQAKKV